MTQEARIIGIHEGKTKGPLFLCFGGIHGNEWSGIKALKKVFELIEEEYQTNPDFSFNGKFIGIKGNINALQQHIRYVDRDLNRSWRSEIVQSIQEKKIANFSEAKDMREILAIVFNEIQSYRPREVVLLDLHTTTADGGIFIIPGVSPSSLELAQQFPVPVITGALAGMNGSTMHFFKTANLNVPTRSVTFESGQHDDPLSVNRAIAIIICCLEVIGCVDKEHVTNKHIELLKTYSKDLPALCKLVTVHSITPEDHFKMRPGFTNFHSVKKGTLLAEDKNGKIFAPSDGYILMPHYQEQGDDGFFLIKPVDTL